MADVLIVGVIDIIHFNMAIIHINSVIIHIQIGLHASQTCILEILVQSSIHIRIMLPIAACRRTLSIFIQRIYLRMSHLIHCILSRDSLVMLQFGSGYRAFSAIERILIALESRIDLVIYIADI